jgi:hypothetical protein
MPTASYPLIKESVKKKLKASKQIFLKYTRNICFDAFNFFLTDSLISGYDAVGIRQVYFRNICFDAFNFFLTDSLISGYDAVGIRQVSMV